MKTSGDIASGNFNEFEANGFQKGVGTAKGWLDLHLSLTPLTGAGRPTRTAIVGGVFGYTWAVGNSLDVDGDVEQDHMFEENNVTEGKLHIHVITNGTNAAARYLKFQFEYTHVNVGETIISSSLITSPELLIPGGTPARTHLVFDLGTFPTKLIGSDINGALTRIAAVGTAPAADPWVSGFHIHARVDTPFGSRNTTSK